MNEFLSVMGKIVDFLKIRFSIYGYRLSFWDIFIWSFVVTLIIGVLTSLNDR